MESCVGICGPAEFPKHFLCSLEPRGPDYTVLLTWFDIDTYPPTVPGTSGTVPDLLLSSPVPPARAYLPWKSREIGSPTTQTFWYSS